MFGNNGVSLSDIAAVTRNDDGFGGNNGWWILILLFAIFGWGNGGYGAFGGSNGSSGAAENYVLASDFATLQRQLDSARTTLESKVDGVNNGICSLGYDQLSQMNGINTNIFNAQTALSTQLNTMAAQNAACCCETKNLIGSSFADLGFKMATSERNIIDNDNANFRAIDARLTAMEMSAKNDKIADLQAQVSALQLAASQQAQNTYIVNQLRPAAVPAYQVPNPYAAYYTGCCSNNNGCCA